MAEGVKAARFDFPPLVLGERVSVSPAAPCARLLVRGEAETAKIIAAVFGVPLPQRPRSTETRGERSALWLGPDEWLLVAPDSEAEELALALRTALADTPHALVDISDRDCGFEIAGPAATLLLNVGIPLDLDLSAFPTETCARTIFGKVAVLLWRTGLDRFRLETARSATPYVVEFLRAGLHGLPE